MKDDTRQLLEEITERATASYEAGRQDLQRALDTATAVALVLSADDGEDCAVMARLIRVLILGPRDVFTALRALEEEVRGLGLLDVADDLGRMWGNPALIARDSGKTDGG
jgi:hypothetical protein